MNLFQHKIEEKKRKKEEEKNCQNKLLLKPSQSDTSEGKSCLISKLVLFRPKKYFMLCITL